MPHPNGPAIRAIREAKGWQGIKFAAACDISRFHLSKIENVPGRYASAALLAKMADVLGVPYAALCTAYTVEQITGKTSPRKTPARAA